MQMKVLFAQYKIIWYITVSNGLAVKNLTFSFLAYLITAIISSDKFFRSFER